ncbi:ABC transporter permease [Chloroflexota bacterium]
MNHLRAVYTIWYRELLRFWRDKIRMIGSITFPLLFLFIFGSGLSSRMGFLGPGIDFTQFMFPGIIGMTVLMGSFMAGVSVVWDREFGFLKEVLVAPISRASVAVGKTLGSATVALPQGIIILLLAPLIGVSLSIYKVLAILPLMFLLAASMGSMGILLATRIRSMQAFQVVMQMLMFPMMFLSGVFFPVEGLPSWMNILVKINPATYGIAPIRQVVLGASPDSPFNISVLGHTMSIWDNIIVMAVFGIVMTLLAMWSFGSQE